jgi:ribosomal protein L37AE/L43A
MECPRCRSTNVTSTGLGTGVWKCMQMTCGQTFDRDSAFKRTTPVRVNGAKG